MKLAILFSVAASAAAFSQDASSRRQAIATGAAAVGAAFLPAAAMAAVGESPRFSVFGLLGDGTSYSEGAAYGSDQSTKTYSPYSVYGEVNGNPNYDPNNKEYSDRKRAVLTETRLRLLKLPKFVSRKEWGNVTTELARFMYETRGAARGLAKTPEQQKAATEFFKSIEVLNLAARQKKQEVAQAAATQAVTDLDAFVSSLK